jgi:hypothetical protein
MAGHLDRGIQGDQENDGAQGQQDELTELVEAQFKSNAVAQPGQGEKKLLLAEKYKGDICEQGRAQHRDDLAQPFDANREEK